MGPLPRQHGLLGAMLTSPVPYRTTDIRRDPRFRGWWPLGAPADALLPRRADRRAPAGSSAPSTSPTRSAPRTFDEADQQLIEMLAAHAALAIENARLYERSRELSIVEERNRLARELHDSVTQKLFGLALDRRGRGDRDRPRPRRGASVQLAAPAAAHARGDGGAALADLRAAPAASAESEGLATALRKHVDVLRSVHGDAVALRLEGDGEPRAGAAEVLRIAQEALQNALRHAEAEPRRRPPRSAVDGRLRVAVADDGVGFDPDEPGLRSRRLGLTSMEERARALGGTLRSTRAPARARPSRLEVAAMIRVLIADDHAVVRQGLRTFLELQDDIEVVGEAADGEEAVQAVARLEPDVALVDLVMPRVDGIEAIGRIRAERPRDARHRPHELRRRRQDAARPCARAPPATCSRTSQPQELVARDPHRPRRRGAARTRRSSRELVREVAARRRGRRAAPDPLTRPRARGAGPASPAAWPTRRSPSSSASPRRRSRPTSATSSASSASPTAPRRRSTPSARGSSRAGRS